MREDFLNLGTHSPLLGYLSTMNANFVPVLDYLICFKSELGLCLQRMIESYNLIIMSQYRGYFNSENTKTKEFSDKVKLLDEKIEEVDHQKAKQDYNQELINTLIASKDTLIKDLNMRLEAAEAKAEELTNYIKDNKLNLAEPGNLTENKRAELKKKIEEADVDSDDMSSDSDL